MYIYIYPPPRLRVRRVLSRCSEARSNLELAGTLHCAPCTRTRTSHLAPALRTSHPHLHLIMYVIVILNVICDLNCSGLRDPRGSALIHLSLLQVRFEGLFWVFKTEVEK